MRPITVFEKRMAGVYTVMIFDLLAERAIESSTFHVDALLTCGSFRPSPKFIFISDIDAVV